MPIAIDSSTPSVVGSNSSSQTTAAFSPPAGALLVAVLMGNPTSSAPTSTGTLSWTARKNQGSSVRIWTAPNVSAQTGITVSCAFSSQGGLKVYVLTGADLTSPVGATGGAANDTTNNLTASAYTSTIAGSRAIGGAVDGAALGTPSSSDLGDPWNNSIGLKGIAVAKATNTANTGSSVTLNFDAAGSSTGSWTWAAVEIAPQPDVPRPAVHVFNRAAVHRAATW